MHTHAYAVDQSTKRLHILTAPTRPVHEGWAARQNTVDGPHHHLPNPPPIPPHPPHPRPPRLSPPLQAHHWAPGSATLRQARTARPWDSAMSRPLVKKKISTFTGQITHRGFRVEGLGFWVEG